MEESISIKFSSVGIDRCPDEPVKRFRGGLVFKAHRLVDHSTLGWGVIKKKKDRPVVKEPFLGELAAVRVRFTSRLDHHLQARPHQRRLSKCVFKAHRLVYDSTLGWRVIKKKKKCGLIKLIRISAGCVRRTPFSGSATPHSLDLF